MKILCKVVSKKLQKNKSYDEKSSKIERVVLFKYRNIV
jgi:hypothetical protein